MRAKPPAGAQDTTARGSRSPLRARPPRGSRGRRLARAVGIAGILLTPLDAASQSGTTSAIRGTVTESAGPAVAGAAVEVRHEATGVTRQAVTNAEGRFLLLLLQPGGPYTLTVRSLGYADHVMRGIRLQVGDTETLDVVLAQQAVAVEGVTVEVERIAVFDPGQVGPATRLGELTLQSMPILSRDLMDLAVLSPLVTTTEGGGFSVLGQNDRYNAILLDGISAKDAFGLSAGGVPGGQAGAKVIPLDAVAQYEVLVAPYDVRLSGFAGGVMNAVTRTGTNEWRVRAQGVHRAEALIGDLELPTGPVDASGVDRSLLGLSVGGPLARDRAHFFVTGEFERRRQPPAGYNLVRDDPALVRIAPDSVSAFAARLRELHGLDAGQEGPYALSQTLSNVFARVDWQVSRRHRITLRGVWAGAEHDAPPNRTGFEPYELSSNAVFRTSRSLSTSVQLFSDFDARRSNELNVELRRSSDGSEPAADWPQVEVDLVSSIGGAAFTRGLRAGGQFFAQENDLTQTTLRLTNTTTFVRPGGAVTLGVTGALYDFDNRFLPGARGDWFFASLDDLVTNAPERFQRNVLTPGAAPEIGFAVAEWGVFAQHRLDAGKGLTMRFGLRLDVPHLLDAPPENAEVLDSFGRSTATLPSGRPLLSPRWGFNWQSDGALRTQVRGGAGVFTGQIPFVWLANAFHNDGLRSLTQYCEGRWYVEPRPPFAAPLFDPRTPPEACFARPFRELRSVVLFDEDFKYPQNFRFSGAVDRELTSSLSASLGFLFNHAVNQLVLEELNLGEPSGSLGPLRGYGGTDRRYFGDPSADGFSPNPQDPRYGPVLLATNESEDWAWSLTAELRGRIGDRLSFQTGYTYARAYDLTSLTFNDMVSNFGLNPTALHPNRPGLGVSDFDRPHKVVAAVYGTPIPGADDTEIALLYTGQSGLPFSYVYRGDLNGDGYPGLGGAFDRTNDLVYVPFEASEVPAGFGTLQILASALEGDACLAAHRGRILGRNECRAPWQNRLDLRVAHTLRRGEAEIRLEGDVINVLDLLGTGWGRVQTIRPVVSLLEPAGRACSRCDLVSSWAGAVLPDRDADGRLRASEPWAVESPASQWQAQLGVRVTFGGGR